MESRRHQAAARWLRTFLPGNPQIETTPANPYHLDRCVWSQRGNNTFSVWEILEDSPEAKARIQDCFLFYEAQYPDNPRPLWVLTLDELGYFTLGYGCRHASGLRLDQYGAALKNSRAA